MPAAPFVVKGDRTVSPGLMGKYICRLWRSGQSSHLLAVSMMVRPAAAIPVDDPYCSCRLTRQLQSLWRIPTAAVSTPRGTHL